MFGFGKKKKLKVAETTPDASTTQNHETMARRDPLRIESTGGGGWCGNRSSEEPDDIVIVPSHEIEYTEKVLSLAKRQAVSNKVQPGGIFKFTLPKNAPISISFAYSLVTQASAHGLECKTKFDNQLTFILHE